MDLEGLQSYLPSWGSVQGWGASTLSIGAYIILGIIFIGICGIGTYFLMRFLKFKNKIVFLGKVGGRWEVVGKDRAMEIPYGHAGDTIFLLQKRRKYLPRPELQTGRRTFWFAIRQDGEYINVQLEDIDLVMKQAKVHFLHPEMRYARTAMQRNFKDRLDKPKFMEKYGHIIIPLMGITIILFFMWLMADKIMGNAAAMNEATKTNKEVMELAKQVLSSIANIKSTSGVVPAG